MASSCKRLAVIGAAGQLGSDIVDVFRATGRYELSAFRHEDLEITDPPAVEKAILGGGFGAVVNCAAFHQVDACEDNPEKALAVNTVGALHVARACRKIDALCVFISTDYVFDGSAPTAYDESAVPAPINIYGASKLAGETLVAQAAGRWLTLRVASLFGRAGAQGKGGNFIDKIIAKARSGGPVKVVTDIRMSPTYTRDAAELLDGLIQADATGIIHGVNAGQCSWFDLAKEAVRLAGLDVPVEPITSDAFASKARRPRNSALVSRRIEPILGRRPRPWQEALRAYMSEKGYVTT